MLATTYDVIVIGGGPSGLMAAAAAGERGAKVLLIEKGEKLGQKLAISGGGRCNVTNRLPVEEIIKHIPGNGRFMYSPFATFNNESIIAFFEGLGIKLKEEDRGRMFPVSNKAKDVVHALVDRVKSVGVEILTQTPVKDVLYQEGRVTGVVLHNEQVVHAQSVVLAVGGKSVPHTGSTGDGYAWAEKAGHTITELFPTEVPLISNEEVIKSKSLQGLALRHVEVSVLNHKGKRIITHEGDMLFTHFGLSGPTILRCSQFVVKELKKGQRKTVTIEVDIHPLKTEEQLIEELQQALEQQPKKSIKNTWLQVVPERLLHYLLSISDIALDTPAQQIKRKEVLHFAYLLKHFQIQVNGTRSIEEAFVTGGGVNLKEIDPKTMQSKLMQHLYFCGEILDIHGYTGGYNITVALSTGYVAGLNAAANLQTLEES